MHPFQKHREHKASHARVKTILKAGGGEIKDQRRYGDDAADPNDNSKPNEWEARMLLGPPKTRDTPGFDTDTSSSRRKKG
jgi:hypothetical protein